MEALEEIDDILQNDTVNDTARIVARDYLLYLVSWKE